MPISITPLILGHGRAGEAIAKSLMSLKILQPELGLQEPVWLKRNSVLSVERAKYERAMLCIAQPHGLHAEAILQADQSGFNAIVCEKPACVNLEEVARLRRVKTPTAILHVYRQMWGLQTLKEMIEAKSFGDLIAIEGRYWQASTAERALQLEAPAKASWKNSTALSGEFDTYLDTGTHWIDAASFLLGEVPSQISGWRSFANAEAPHRDSHVQLALDYAGGGRAFASISKTIHGAANHFEINVIGTKGSATWQFLKPDEILIGQGRDHKTITRKTQDTGSWQPPFHGTGWLEGYIEISRRLINQTFYAKPSSFPHLAGNLDLLTSMLSANWSNR